MLIGEFGKVNISKKNYKKFEELGYILDGYNPIFVKIEHLLKGSSAIVDVSCDYCGKEIKRRYVDYIDMLERSHIKKDCCKECIGKKDNETYFFLFGVYKKINSPESKEKAKKTNLEKFGYEWCLQSPKIREKISEKWENYSEEKREEIDEKRKSTTLERYGKERYVQTEEYLDKKKETSLLRYGVEEPSWTPEAREKRKATNLEKYNNEFYFGSDEFKKFSSEYWENISAEEMESKKQKIKAFWENVSEEKMSEMLDARRKTNMEKYGVGCIFELPEYRKNLYDKCGYPTSKKQMELFEMVRKMFPDALENVEFYQYLLDILITIDGINVVVEYDCWYWHNPTSDERKNNTVLSKGYKLLRIKSGKTLPNSNLLFSKIHELLTSDTLYSEIVLKDWNEEEYQLKGG